LGVETSTKDNFVGEGNYLLDGRICSSPVQPVVVPRASAPPVAAPP
jgi:hypothetical protein